MRSLLQETAWTISTGVPEVGITKVHLRDVKCEEISPSEPIPMANGVDFSTRYDPDVYSTYEDHLGSSCYPGTGL